MKRLLKWLGGLAALAVVLAALAAAGVYVALRNTVPSPSGSLVIAGLSAPVEVVRDREGVPHIFAKSIEDLFCALGFIHAQDRLWQMELLRRSGQGRLSEVFGERAFSTDVFLRTLDLYGHAERSVTALAPEAKRTLEAYAKGVNAFIERRTGLFEPRLPPEFLLLRHAPEPWRHADSVVGVKMMALNLGTNINFEIARLSYAAQGLTAAEIEDLMPPDLKDAAPPLPEIAQLYPLRRTATAKRQASAPVLEPIGDGASNNWVVAGTHTRSGKPLLANDPHLRLSAPAIWYLAHLALERPGASTVNVAGATLAGVPLVVLGRGDSLAWGFTNTGPDVQDIFIERINPENPLEYLTPDGWRPFQSETMSIAVKGAGVRTVERRRTRHGPVLPGFYRNLEAVLGPGHVAALQWTALSDDDTTIAGGMLDPNVHTVDDYMARMRAYVVPMQSMVVADTTGKIGLIAPGRVPVRDPANKVAGRAPVPGWDATYDWKGYLRFEDLPRVLNPPEGAIGTANARMVGPDYPHLLTYDWDPDYRQQRVKELVIGRSGHDMASMRAAQNDVFDPAFARLQTLMIAAAQAGGEVDNAVLDQLTVWDTNMRADAPEPLIFTAWVREAVKAIYRDDLGPAFERFFGTRAPALIRLLEGNAKGRDWCDDRVTPERESCGAILAGALKSALGDLEQRFGPDRTKWRWGAAHFAHGEHRPLGLMGGRIGTFFNVEVPSPGGSYTLNRGMMEFGEDAPFANRHASSYRAIYDLADLDASLYIHTTGQSGNPFSPGYRSFAERWSKGEYITIATKRADIAKAAVGTWRLMPP
jgi:penicillin G amidase